MREYEPGYYKGTIVSWTLGESNEKNTPQFCVTFTVDEREVGGGTVPASGGERTVFRAITEGTAKYVVKDLRALGYDRDNFDDLDPESANAFDFAGLPVRVRCKYEEYKGEEKERWDFAMGAGLQVKKLEPKGVSKLNAVFGGMLRASKPSAAAPAPRALPRPPASQAAQDDTPF
jgi:hypothetical protein